MNSPLPRQLQLPGFRVGARPFWFHPRQPPPLIPFRSRSWRSGQRAAMHRGRLRVGAVRIAKPPEPRLADSARTLRAKSSTPAPEPRCYPAASTSDFARRPVPGAVASRTASDRTADATDSERLLNVKTEQYVSVPNGTENSHKASGGGFLCRLGGVSERPELPALNRIGQREGIPAQEVDVVGDQGREAGKVLRFDGEPL